MRLLRSDRPQWPLQQTYTVILESKVKFIQRSRILGSISLSICQPEELRLLIYAVLAQRVVHGRPQLLLEDVLLALLIAALAPRGRSSFGRRRLCSLPTCGSKSDVRISFRRRVDFY